MAWHKIRGKALLSLHRRTLHQTKCLPQLLRPDHGCSHALHVSHCPLHQTDPGKPSAITLANRVHAPPENQPTQSIRPSGTKRSSNVTRNRHSRYLAKCAIRFPTAPSSLQKYARRRHRDCRRQAQKKFLRRRRPSITGSFRRPTLTLSPSLLPCAPALRGNGCRRTLHRRNTDAIPT